jgi:hypothetical protein
LLTRVDGLVLMTPSLAVKGFGVFVTPAVDKPSEIFTTNAAKANLSRLSRLNYDHFGTRHQSMMRYCAKHPGSVGFVVSQDGAVRAMTSIESRLVVWRNVSLQNIRQLREPRLTIREFEPEYARIYESKWREVALPTEKLAFSDVSNVPTTLRNAFEARTRENSYDEKPTSDVRKRTAPRVHGSAQRAYTAVAVRQANT